MRIRIACVGRLKEAYLEQAVQEYEKRLSRYAQLEILEVADQPAPERLSPAQRKQVLDLEGERLLKCVGPKSCLIALCIEGKQYTSEAFAKAYTDWMQLGGASLVFAIGGSWGLSEGVLNRADFKLSLSNMTFPHQLARILLLEQLYRANRICNNEPYHK